MVLFLSIMFILMNVVWAAVLIFIMQSYEYKNHNFVNEIKYIVANHDDDDDIISCEVLCRKLYKYGYIKRDDHDWFIEYEE